MHLDPGLWQLVLYFFLMALSTNANSNGTPRFISEPLSTVQKLGGSVTLLCTAEPSRAHVSWVFNGESLDTTQTPDVQAQAGYLTMSSLSHTQVGRYQCIVNTSRGAIISQPATVSLPYLDDYDTPPRLSVTADEGSSAFIKCNLPDSNPKARARYRVRNLFWLEESTDKYIILPSGNLQILNVSSSDQGTYRCEAHNPFSNSVKKVQRKLTVRPSSERDPDIPHPVVSQTLLVHLHETVSLECVVDGSEAPQVYWTKDGQDALARGKRKLLHTHLILENVGRADAGNYSCVMGNDAKGSRRGNYTVIVLEPPSVSRVLEDQSALVGDFVRFICEARGTPAPNVTWLHNTVPVYPTSRYQVSGNRLRISKLIAEDSGMYQCIVDNGVGAAQSAARLLVRSETGSRPVIVSPPANVTVFQGDLVSLICNATGTPTPTIRWYDRHGPISSHPSQVLLSKSRKSQQGRTAAASAPQDPVHLTMTQAGSSALYVRATAVQQAVKYTCEASNEYGSAQAEAFLATVPYEMITKPEDSTPLDLTQSDEGEYESDTGSPDPTQPGGHQPGTDKPISGAFFPEAPIILSPPQTSEAYMYHLKWRSGKDGGLPINAYFVRYRKLDGDSNKENWNSIRVPASENEFPLTELEPSSLYEVLMVARNAAGEGQPAMLTFRTSKERSSSSKNTQAPSPPAGAPNLPVLHERSNYNFGLVPKSGAPEAPDRPTISIASETSVYVTWIPRANGGSPITSFKVEYKREEKGRYWITAAENIPPSMLSVEVSKLEPGVTYKFRVMAQNTHGNSKPSSTSQQYQVAGYSNRIANRLTVGPRIDHTEAVTDTKIMLKWTYIPSNNNNTPIQGFYIYYRPTDSDNDSDYKREKVDGARHSHLISNLQPETSYDIKMRCYNEQGESDFSNVMMCETKARRNPGASEYPVLEHSTPATVDRVGGSSGVSNTLARSGDMLYVIVGCVLGGMVLILMAFIAMCLLKNRQQSLMQKFEPPGYLYQGADLNGQIIEYTTLPGTSLINGSVRGGFIGNGNLSNGCPHMHHKVHNGTNGVINGEPYPGCTNSLNGSYMDYERLPHHLSNGGVMYTAIPQTEPSDCVNCRNCRNNNRCFTKANGVPMMPMVSAFPQDNPESKTPDHVIVPMCLASSDLESSPEMDGAHQEKDTPSSADTTTEEEPPQTHTPCQEGDECPSLVEGRSILTWDPLTLPSVSKDFDEKRDWTTMGITLDSSTVDLQDVQTQEA